MGLVPEIMLVVIVDINTFIFQKLTLHIYSRPVVAVLVSKGKKTELKMQNTDEQPAKRQRLTGPPKHSESFKLMIKMTWWIKRSEKQAEANLMLDSGATGPVLSTRWVQKHQIPCTKRKHPEPITDASGNHIPGTGTHFTHTIQLTIGNHQDSMRFELAELADPHIDGYLPMSWLETHNPDIDWMKGTISWRSDYCRKNCLPPNKKIELISDYQMMRIKRNKRHLLGMAIFHDEDGEDIAIRLLDEYKDYADIFSQEKIQKLPEHSEYDHKIELMPGTTPPFGPIYPLSESELKLLREYLDEMLQSGKIRKSTSPAAAPILFAPKKDGSLCLYIDYRGLNKITVKNRYPLPLMNELRDRLGKARYFTKLDLKNGYYLLRMAQGHEWKTAFRCRYGLYEYKVMPFGLCNAPSTFQSMINDVFRDVLDEGVIAYMDDILIYSESLEEHVELVRRVMQKIRDAGLCISIKKSIFHQKEVEFLGYYISESGIRMTTDKVETVRDWPTPDRVKDVQAFLGFANFYRRFIKGFSKICTPLTNLTRNEVPWNWSSACEEAFTLLKKRFTEEPVLAHFNSSRKTKLETDASDFALGAVLSQLCEDGKWHPVAFHSRKFQPAEINYDVHDKEMTAIVAAFKEWDHLLRSAEDVIVIYTDHRNLEYFNTTKVLNRRQHRWGEFLQPFNFCVVYREGRLNQKADALSRRRDYRLEGGSEIPEDIAQSFFRPGQWQVEGERWILTSRMLGAIRGFRLHCIFQSELRNAARMDADYQQLLTNCKVEGSEVDKNITVEDGLLLFKNRWYIPENKELKLKILAAEHDSRIAGHFGIYKTMDRVRANFFWQDMDKEVEQYVRTCDTCQRNKSTRHKRFGLLEPLDIPNRPWEAISMDFIVALPESDGYTKVWVVVDRFSKMAHFT